MRMSWRSTVAARMCAVSSSAENTLRCDVVDALASREGSSEFELRRDLGIGRRVRDEQRAQFVDGDAQVIDLIDPEAALGGEGGSDEPARAEHSLSLLEKSERRHSHASTGNWSVSPVISSSLAVVG